ncbi:hypothetical protein FRC18_005838 [Serendipita sp. 400]|nr:hypothetical protein FRC18_005838 [Serendipita sp. 400]
MSHYPCTTLSIDQNIIATIYGPYIRVLDVFSGTLLAETSPTSITTDNRIKSSTKLASIRHVAVVASSRKLVTIDEQKMLKVFDLENNLALLNSR